MGGDQTRMTCNGTRTLWHPFRKHCKSVACHQEGVRGTGRNILCRKDGWLKRKGVHNACGGQSHMWHIYSVSQCLLLCNHHTWMEILCTQIWVCVGDGWSGKFHCISWLSFFFFWFMLKNLGGHIYIGHVLWFSLSMVKRGLVKWPTRVMEWLVAEAIVGNYTCCWW